MSEEVPLVNRCECLGEKFSKLKELGSLEAAMDAGAGQECEGCLPYVKLMFASGEIEFDLEDPRLAEFE
ncbi:MAG: hypothetical protein R8K22_02920 [Mariprofundaceae bacterium]